MSKPKIVSLGRLFPVKGHDILIKAFAQLAARHPQWSLVIWGEGPERPVLEALIHSFGLSGRASIPGSTKQVAACLRQGDLFVLPSRTEGFPNALTEAMACGLPVIATNCGGAIEDIVRNDENGILVPPDDVDALATAMDRIMSNPQERARLAARAPEVAERFSLERVLELWDKAIGQALADVG
jgi:glycosyltransferase involved in cell wall biosynthesis